VAIKKGINAMNIFKLFEWLESDPKQTHTTQIEVQQLGIAKFVKVERR